MGQLARHFNVLTSCVMSTIVPHDVADDGH